MRDSELFFNTVSAIAIGLVVSMAPGAARAASDESPVLYEFSKVGNASTFGGCYGDNRSWTI
jgi:hypothetical protein